MKKNKKENKMKNSTKARIIAGGLAVALLFIACAKEPKEDPIVTPEPAKDQEAKLENLFDVNCSATVKGHLTDAEWAGVADKVEAALNDGFNSLQGIDGAVLKGKFRKVFGNGDIEIIVEKNPVGYTKWKTSADGKTLWLAYGALDNNLQGSVVAAVDKMNTPEAGLAQLNKQNRVRFGGAMSPYELVQFNKKGYVRA